MGAFTSLSVHRDVVDGVRAMQRLGVRLVTLSNGSTSVAMLVAVHPWDIDGAARAGLRTGWLNRTTARYPSYFTPPDIVATDLVELADSWH